MCYGMGCPEEQGYTGECMLHAGPYPCEVEEVFGEDEGEE